MPLRLYIASINSSNRIPHILRLLAGFVLVLISARIAVASISLDRRTTTTTRQNNGSILPKFPLPGIKPDTFVLVSPLVIGVVCRDGVLLIALHEVFSTEHGRRNESTLLWKSNDSIAQSQPQPQHHDGVNQTKVESLSELSQKDLPRSYRGPFRIYPLGSSGTTAMVCAGWRTDCQYLANCIRSIDKKEQLVFGSPSISSSAVLEYGSYLACQASLLMAKLCVSMSKRPLSCLGLLASGTGLWLVDSTGAYRIRAHAVGIGTDRMNDHLRRKDWTKLDCNEAATNLLKVLFDDDLEELDNDSNTDVKIPKESLVEIATVGIPETNKLDRKMRRLFASKLFGKHDKN